jgi:RNA-binding protein YhbY
MKLPRDLKGSDLAKALCRDWGSRIVQQEGSHLILQTEIPSHQRISSPDHTLSG